MTKKFETTLFDYVRLNPNLEISRRLKIWEKVAEGVEAIHKRGVRHFDLKAMNIFVDIDHNDVQELAIADFGIGNADKNADDHCGTPGVGSPEQFTTYASRGSDIFSLGKLSVQIIFPWDTYWGIMGTSVEQRQIDKFRNTHKVFEKFHDLILSMLKVGQDKK